ncbi:MAG: zf-HC2 domain-containing protein [Thermoanaerobaculia bacterium]|nr:zf-HC2 domain-containing protein [Thermoanaerobaculia bacterium]
MNSHPTTSILESLVEGELPPDAQEQVLEHLSTCAPCFAQVDNRLVGPMEVASEEPSMAPDFHATEQTLFHRIRRANTLNDLVELASCSFMVFLGLVKPLLEFLEPRDQDD